MQDKELALKLFMEASEAMIKFHWSLSNIKRKLGTEAVKDALELYMPVLEKGIKELTEDEHV